MNHTKEDYVRAVHDNWAYCENEFAEQIRQTVLNCLNKMTKAELKEVYETHHNITHKTLED